MRGSMASKDIEETEGHAPNYPMIGDTEPYIRIVSQPKGN